MNGTYENEGRKNYFLSFARAAEDNAPALLVLSLPGSSHSRQLKQEKKISLKLPAWAVAGSLRI